MSVMLASIHQFNEIVQFNIKGDACYPNPCGQNGECSKFGLNGYTCQCFPGYLGENCEIRKNYWKSQNKIRKNKKKTTSK